MRIKTLRFHRLSIPFKVAFKHSSAFRNTTESIWVEADGDNGLTGNGESCPRFYVTGETLETARQYFGSIKDLLVAEMHGIDDLDRWVAVEKDVIDKNPAAWCAVELALLDLFAKTAHTSVEEMLGLPAVRGTFRYSAVLGDSGIDVYQAQLDKYLALGFKDYKIKVSGDIDKDKEKLACLEKAGDHSFRVRLDANNLWQKPLEAIEYIRSLGYPVWAIEEPLTVGDFKGLTKIANRLKVKIILDESFLNIAHFAFLEENPDLWIINLRISKMGGLIRSKNIVDTAARAGIGLIIGAHVGETSLLTRAALSIAQFVKSSLMAQEGAFGTHLLGHDIVDSSLMFGKGGELDTEILELPGLPGFGLSLTSIEDYLMRL